MLMLVLFWRTLSPPKAMDVRLAGLDDVRLVAELPLLLAEGGLPWMERSFTASFSAKAVLPLLDTFLIFDFSKLEIIWLTRCKLFEFFVSARHRT